MFKYAKLLEIDSLKNNEKNYTVNLKWHNPDEAKIILQDTLDLVTKNLKEIINSELEQILEFEKKLTLNEDIVRLNYLKEQSAIAKELNITDNQIDNVNLSQSSVSLNISTADIAYYLRGYKAINKEIELIENRNYQNFKSTKDTKLILMISILLGLIVGVFFVLISNAFQAKK